MTRGRLSSLLALMLLVLNMACVSAARNSTAYDRSGISREELAERSASNLYDVVSAIRPSWLRSTPAAIGRAATTSPLVYIDGRPAGQVDALRSISPQSVEHARHLSASEAQNKYSMSQARPVIDLTTRGLPP